MGETRPYQAGVRVRVPYALPTQFSLGKTPLKRFITGYQAVGKWPRGVLFGGQMRQNGQSNLQIQAAFLVAPPDFAFGDFIPVSIITPGSSSHMGSVDECPSKKPQPNRVRHMLTSLQTRNHGQKSVSSSPARRHGQGQRISATIFAQLSDSASERRTYTRGNQTRAQGAETFLAGTNPSL
jgi:hypothetical protein